MIKTYDMDVAFVDGTTKHFTNLSRVAVKRYKQHFEYTLCVHFIVVRRSEGVR